MNRRQLQIALGLFWLLDAALQAQPFMFTSGFAHQVIAPAAFGQPAPVAASVNWAAHLVGTNPPAFNTLFAAVQLLLGIGLLMPATARVALGASIAWALGVWYLGEGLSGLASAHASLLTGAPGSALLYATLAAAAWPRTGRAGQRPAPWLGLAWAVIWTSGAILALLPGQIGSDAIAATIRSEAVGAPGWLAGVAGWLARVAMQGGTVAVMTLPCVEVAIGALALKRPARAAALVAGAFLSVAFWVAGQDLGQLYSGRATDPNTGPLLVLMAVSLWPLRPNTPARSATNHPIALQPAQP